MKDKLLRWLNWALVADFFLVLCGFFWLAIAVVGRTAGLPLGLELWYQLWQWVFSPAIGILIGGTIVSGLARWLVKLLNKREFRAGNSEQGGTERLGLK